MALFGMPLSTLLAVFGGASAVVVGLYILKLRRRAVPVAFARIWQELLGDRETTTFFSQLKRWLSLLLQLCLLALLVLALGDPRPSAGKSRARHVVLLVDTSASMDATDEPETRLGLAKKEGLALISGLGADDHLLVASMSASVEAKTPLTTDQALLREALLGLKANDTKADLSQALAFAHDILKGLSQPEVVLLSDGGFADQAGQADNAALSGIPKSFVPVGREPDNVAITQFSARRYPLDTSRYEVLLTLANTGPKDALVEVSLLGDGQLLELAQLSLGAGQESSRFFENLSSANRRLEARLRVVEGKDYLARDNHAYALMPERRRARVLVVTPSNTYLEAALLLDEYLDVTFVKPASFTEGGNYDVTIFDGVAPSRPENSGPALYLNPSGPASPVKIARTIRGFGFDDWDKKSPILRQLALADVQVAIGSSLLAEKGDRVLGKSELGPILVSGVRNGAPFLALGFDPRQSDFVLRVAWPLFVLNVINAFVEQNNEYLSSYRTGDVWRVPAPGAFSWATLLEPGGAERRVSIREGRAIIAGEVAGFYTLRAEDGSEREFAANLADPDESRIAPVAELELGDGKLLAPEGFDPGLRQRFWGYLLLVVVFLSLLEWFAYHRRVTV